MTPESAYADPVEVTSEQLASETELWADEPIPVSDPLLPGAITNAASRQTYYTIRCLVDRDRRLDAYRAYAYFRWLDDVIDESRMPPAERIAFVERQQALLAQWSEGAAVRAASSEEQMLVELMGRNRQQNSGLRAYFENMMTVMAFDARRRGRIVSEAELADYSAALATGVTEAMHYCIGHDQPPPPSSGRYLAVTAAHITHMLRDTCEDVAAGYFNISREFLNAHRIDPGDIESDAYRLWVRNRVQQARAYFKAGKQYLSRVPSLRCRIAGYAYAARFEWVLDLIETDHYQLRSSYSERSGLRPALHMGWAAFKDTVWHSL